VNARARLFLVLAAALPLAACAEESDEDLAHGRTIVHPKSQFSLVESGATDPVVYRRDASGGGDGPVVEANAAAVDFARLTHIVLTVDVEDEGAINRMLLGLGVGVRQRGNDTTRHVVESLTTLAQNERAAVRRGAIALLARMQPGRAVGDPFANAMIDADAGVRRQGVIGRTRHGVGLYWKQMTAHLADPDPGVRAAVAKGLGCVGNQGAREALAVLLRDSDDGVVEAAALSLAAGDASDASAAAFEAAHSPRPNVRRAAAIVFSGGRSADALKQLVALAGDEATTVRREAVWGLSGVGGDAAVEARLAVEAIAFDAERRGRDERFEAIQGLARTKSEPNRDALLAVAEHDGDALLRLMAARTLALRGDSRALPLLVGFLGSASRAGLDEDEASFVRITADSVLRDLAGGARGARAAEDWRKSLPEMEARFAKGRASDAPAKRLAQLW
jgi:HEAT repeat protein